MRTSQQNLKDLGYTVRDYAGVITASYRGVEHRLVRQPAPAGRHNSAYEPYRDSVLVYSNSLGERFTVTRHRKVKTNNLQPLSAEAEHFFFAWAADTSIPWGLCSNREDHSPHLVEMSSLGSFYCHADHTKRISENGPWVKSLGEYIPDRGYIKTRKE